MNEFSAPKAPGELDYVIPQPETIQRQQAEVVSNLPAISGSQRNVSAVATRCWSSWWPAASFSKAERFS